MINLLFCRTCEMFQDTTACWMYQDTDTRPPQPRHMATACLDCLLLLKKSWWPPMSNGCSGILRTLFKQVLCHKPITFWSPWMQLQGWLGKGAVLKQVVRGRSYSCTQHSTNNTPKCTVQQETYNATSTVLQQCRVHIGVQKIAIHYIPTHKNSSSMMCSRTRRTAKTAQSSECEHELGRNRRYVVVGP